MAQTDAFSHTPVMPAECMESLDIKPGGVYVDCTLGGGGHSSLILQRLDSEGRLYGIDRDADAIAAATARIGADPRFTALRGNFHDIRTLLQAVGVAHIDGALMDLGVSSWQLDSAERGFSYHADAPLDMRMDRSQSFSARELVNTYSQAELTRVLRDWGEENWAAQIARVICDRRKKQPIETTAQLVDIIDAAIPAKFRRSDAGHPARRTFQALRIEVNDELSPLAAALEDAVHLLNDGGRLCVMAFHSLEDRVVKQTFKRLQRPCVCPPSFPVCVCGKKSLGYPLSGKPITASPEECEANPRARSATLRTFVRDMSAGE